MNARSLDDVRAISAGLFGRDGEGKRLWFRSMVGFQSASANAQNRRGETVQASTRAAVVLKRLDDGG